MKGFFDTSVPDTKRRKTLPLVPSCNACGLYRTCKSPKMPVDGEGRKKILVVGEPPGKNEDDQGKPFVGMSGQMVEEAMANAGIDFRKDCWITNAASCHPIGNKKTPKMVEYCRPLVIKHILELKPEVIILLGGSAIESVIEWSWGDKENLGAVGRWVGWKIPCQKTNAWIAPTWHPSYLKREENREDNNKENPIEKMFFQRHITEAVNLAGKRPWKNVPDWKNQVRVIMDDREAAKVIADFTSDDQDDLVAFDYETNMLKPDASNARIVSCALSDGVTTIAYPWLGKAIKATKRFLESKVPKVASNAKFEHRWSQRILGVRVRNWKLDTMLAAHVLDNRPAISGLKFQAYVRLGMPIYNAEVEPFFQASTCNAENRIKQIPLRDLLVYNGLDALLEYKLAKKQLKDLGM